MSPKRVVLRARASRDIDDALEYYLREAGEAIASQFVDVLRKDLDGIGSFPGSGSPRYAHELDLSDLRCRFLRPFPYLVFYLEREDHVDVWRVLQAERDIPASMRAEDDPIPSR